jgi:hypothetical protein
MLVLGRTTYQIHVLDQLEKERNSKLSTCNLMFWCPLPLKPTPFVVMAIKFTTTATNVPKCRTGRGMTFGRKKSCSFIIWERDFDSVLIYISKLCLSCTTHFSEFELTMVMFSRNSNSTPQGTCGAKLSFPNKLSIELMILEDQKKAKHSRMKEQAF